ncbi:hypothetical protein FRC09_010958 [Ceratobasidium sp. 395]|nr:hypothetical protein FRC09_010958 [Ceratobasidium sp. 395]
MVVITVDAILFDMDGTLIDSTPGVLGAWDQFGKDYPFLNIQEILEISDEATEGSHGVRSIDTLRRWLRLDDEEKLEAEVTRFESEVIRHGLVLLPGVQRVLDQLKEGSTEELPATRWYAPQALKSVNIPLPRHMVMAEDVEHGKPSPDPYLQGAKNCHVDPKNCLVIEDAVSGMRAGRAAGAKVLGVCTSAPRETVEKGEPDYIVQDLTKSSPYDSFSPSFQLCLSDTQECGEAVWPHIKRLTNGTYSITMAIPDLGEDNAFFIRMEDDDGVHSDTPMFKLQASPDQQGQASSPGSSSGSSSSTADSASSRQSNPNSTPSGGNGDKSNRGSSNDSKDGESETGSKGTGGARISEIPMPSATMSNSTSSPVGTVSTTASLLPSATNKALVATSENNKPSTIAIVIPLAIFAAALAGLVFSLRQRSKAKKEIERQNGTSRDEPSLHRTVSKESSSVTSQSSTGSAGKTDLERAIEFISGIQVPRSPGLTPLPPSIESRRHARMQNKLERDAVSQADLVEAARVQITKPDISEVAGRPTGVQYVGPYTNYPGYGRDSALYQLPTIPRAVPLIDPSTYATLVPENGFWPGVPHTVIGMPPSLGGPGGSVSGVPRPSTVPLPQAPDHLPYPSEQRHHCSVVIANQESDVLTSVNASQPAEFAPNHAPVPPPTAPSVEPLPAPPVLPASLRVARPRPPSPLDYAAINQTRTQATQPHESVSSVVGPAIPYATRPSSSSTTLSSTLSDLPNPYAAIEMALRAGV